MSFQNIKKTVGRYSYLTRDKIGDGCSSEVYRGIDEKTKESVAIKVVPKLMHKRNEQLEMAQAEIKALTQLKDCENILKLKEVFETRNSIYIITQLCERGTLRQVLAKERKFPEARAIAILRQIIRGYQAIHGHRLIHRDIKTDNIFLNAEDQVFIGDFGFAIDAEQCLEPSRENIGSPLYMAYETLTGNVYTFKSDVWAIGVTFYEMLNGKTPWKSKTEKELENQLENFKVDSALKGKITENSFCFLEKVLVRNESERMSPEELFSYSFDSPSFPLSKQNSLQALNLIKPKLCVTFAPSECQKAVEKTQFRQKCDSKHQQFERGSEPSTQEHSKSKKRIEQIKQNSKLLTEPKPKIACSTIVISPRMKEPIDKKVGGSLIGMEEFTKKMNDDSSGGKNKTQVVEKNESNSTKLSGFSEERLTSKTQKQILSEVQSQINYFRFLFKLAKRMGETLKTSDEHIKALEEYLLYLVDIKIKEIELLRGLSFPSKVAEAFRLTPEFKNLTEVLKQYRERYSKEEERLGRHPALAEREPSRLVGYCLKVLYQNILKVEGSVQELHRKRGLVYIAEELVQLKRLSALEKEGWASFHQISEIGKTLEKPQEENLRERWEMVKPTIRKYTLV